MTTNTIELDVLIIGAGISGIGAAYHLQKHCPDKRYAIIEARAAVGGTWDLFRYPGIRSDSDMYTFGYHFKPWQSPKGISPAKDIKAYISEAARENGIDKRIVFEHKVIKANWNSATAKWHTEVKNLQSGETLHYRSSFFFSCAGYYNYDQAYTPDFNGLEQFQGEVIHPQFWPEDLDYSGKKVIVIGSGATAITLVPSMSTKASHVTMLQRSPTYIVSVAAENKLANFFRRHLPEKFAYSLNRWIRVLMGIVFFQMSRRRPEWVKSLLRKGVVDVLGEDYEVDKHFKPSYQPWDQRVCLVPDNDFFEAIKSGSASVVTDHIDCFTSEGIKLKSGENLSADIIVTATGLQAEVLRSYQIMVDGSAYNPAEHYCYKGMMLSGLPNFAFSMGYTNSSWTLKSDLVGQYVCRLINHMDKQHYDYCQPVLPSEGLQDEPFMDFSSGYIERAQGKMPKQGNIKPWKLYQNYIVDRISLGLQSVIDKSIVFSSITRK